MRCCAVATDGQEFNHRCYTFNDQALIPFMLQKFVCVVAPVATVGPATYRSQVIHPHQVKR